MVIESGMPCCGAPFPELGDAARIGLHLVIGERGLVASGLERFALDGAADFAIDYAGRIDA